MVQQPNEADGLKDGARDEILREISDTLSGAIENERHKLLSRIKKLKKSKPEDHEIYPFF